MLIEIKKLFYGEITPFREKFYEDNPPPPFKAISPTRDLFGTPIVNKWGFKNLLSYFSSKMLFEIKKSFYN